MKERLSSEEIKEVFYGTSDEEVRHAYDVLQRILMNSPDYHRITAASPLSDALQLLHDTRNHGDLPKTRADVEKAYRKRDAAWRKQGIDIAPGVTVDEVKARVTLSLARAWRPREDDQAASTQPQRRQKAKAQPRGADQTGPS